MDALTRVYFLPGMMCDERLFTPQIACLSKDYDVIVGDITGHDSISAIATSFLSTAPEKFSLAGLSMGGIVAMEIMAQAPHRVERLALLDTNPCAELPAMKMRRSSQLEKVEAGLLRVVMCDEMKPNYLAPGSGKQTILDLCLEMAEDLGADVFRRQSHALRDRVDQQETLRKISVPSLILCGREDRACPVERHTMMHRLIPNSTLVIVEGAGHLPTLESPEVTNAALLQWLAAAV